MNDSLSVTLTYDSFARLWQALVSKRKARKLDVDTDQAWAQLRSDGPAAHFLQAHAARDEKKRKRERATPKD